MAGKKLKMSSKKISSKVDYPDDASSVCVFNELIVSPPRKNKCIAKTISEANNNDAQWNELQKKYEHQQQIIAKQQQMLESSIENYRILEEKLKVRINIILNSLISSFLTCRS
jgi:N-acetylglutamate synthase-like GNAT family acetyltransferase